MDLGSKNQSECRVGVADCASHVGESLRAKGEHYICRRREGPGSLSENRIVSVQLGDGPNHVHNVANKACEAERSVVSSHNCSYYGVRHTQDDFQH
jgi:hypothetical protein